MFFGNFEKFFDRLWPQAVLTKWVTAGQHDATLDAIGNAGLLILCPNNTLVQPSRKITQRVLLEIVLDKFLDDFEFFITHLWSGFDSAEIKPNRDHNEEDAESSQGKSQCIISAVRNEFNGAGDSD